MMIYWNIGILMDLINWLLNSKMHVKTLICFFCMKLLNDMIFYIYFLEIWLYITSKKIFFFYLKVSWNKNMPES